MKRKLLAVLTGGMYDDQRLWEGLRQCGLRRKRTQRKMK